MTDQPKEYEEPRVEQVDTDGRPLATAAGGTVPTAAGGSKVEELD